MKSRPGDRWTSVAPCEWALATSVADVDPEKCLTGAFAGRLMCEYETRRK